MDRPLVSVKNDKSQVQVIARAATILRALEEENAGLSLGQIAQRVKLARSTVQRIVAALETESLVIAATPNGRVRLGPAILRLAASVRSDFIAAARPFLERLSAELQETVDLSVVKKDHLVFIDQVIAPQRLRTVSAVGETFPLYCTANGKAYLSQLTEPSIEKLIGRVYEARTPNTLTRFETLLRGARQGARQRRRRLRPRGTHPRHLRGGRGLARSARQFGRHFGAGAEPAFRRPARAHRRAPARHQTRHGESYERSRRLNQSCRWRQAGYQSATQAQRAQT